jgi:zinc-ribbon domain
MASFCSNCGHDLREGAKFCDECGSAVGENHSQPPAERWEYCEIMSTVVKETQKWYYGGGEYDRVLAFRAEAIGEQGIYTAGESRTWKSRDGGRTPMKEDEQVRTIHKEFVAHLISEGWQPRPDDAGPGKFWYNYKFRRQLKK